MKYTIKAWLAALAVILALVGMALAQTGKPELWNGTHWKQFSQEIKVAYIKGIGNMADFEVAASGKKQVGCISAAFVDELKNKSINGIIKEVDAYYQENPKKLDTSVIEVVLRRCTAVCKPEAATPKKK